MSDNLVFQAAVQTDGQAYHVPEIFTLQLTQDVVKFLRRAASAVEAFASISSEFTHVEYPLEKGVGGWLYMADDFTPPFTFLISRAGEGLTGVPTNIGDTFVEVRRDGLVFKVRGAVEWFTSPVQIDEIDPQDTPAISSQEMYTLAFGLVCPSCNAADSVETIGARAMEESGGCQPMRCVVCGATWKEITAIEIVGFEELEPIHA